MTDDETRKAYREKLLSISFGVVPGAYRDSSSTTMIDKDAFLDQFGDSQGSLFSEERVKDNQSDARSKLKEWGELG